MEALKTAEADVVAQDRSVRAIVEQMLADIRENGEGAVREIAAKTGTAGAATSCLPRRRRQALIDSVPESEKADIRFAHAQVKRFAAAQRASISEFDLETEPGVRLGQKLIPVQCAGCYVPGWPLCPCGICDHERDNGQGRRRAIHRGSLTAQGRRHRGSHSLRDGPGRRRYDPGTGRRTGHCDHGPRPLRLQAGRHSGRSGERLCRGSQAAAVRRGRNRSFCRADGERGHRGRDGGPR